MQSAQLQGPARVLLVIDRPTVARLLSFMLGHSPCVTRTASQREEAAAMLREWRPHLVVLDMEVAGDELMAQLEAHGGGTLRLPVVALTRRGDLKTKLAAFERGVDDILTIPFAPEELVARVLAVMRRSYREAHTFAPTLTIGDLEIDILSRSVRVDDHELHLTPLEQGLLYLLAANAGRVMTRDEILDNLWGTDFSASSNIVDQLVRQLRARLQNDWRKPRFIATVPGKGYRFLPTNDAETDALLPN